MAAFLTDTSPQLLVFFFFYLMFCSGEPVYLITQLPSAANSNEHPKCPEITHRLLLAVMYLCLSVFPQDLHSMGIQGISPWLKDLLDLSTPSSTTKGHLHLPRAHLKPAMKGYYTH